MVLMLLVVSGVVTLALQTTRMARTHPDRFELHQRARVALDLVTADLRAAGAGVDRGPATGVLAGTFPGVWPRRLGLGGDAPAVARRDVITLVAVPDTLAQTTAVTSVDAGTAAMVVTPAAHCTPSRPACGFGVGTPVGVFDSTGVWSLWRTDRVIGQTLTVRPLAVSGEAVAPGAVVTELLVRGYLHDPATQQLRYFNGNAATQPVIDGVTGWSIRYFDAFGELPIEALADGPWRGSGATQFDVDQLRIRRVRVDLTVAEGQQTYRASVEIAPRNLAPTGTLP
jgi:Tfp pilus assembly protein PilW